MAKVVASILIDKPIDEVFEYTASPLNGPAFIPNLNENTNIQPEKSSVGQTFDWRFNMAGVDLRGKAEVTEFEPPHKVKIVTTGDSNTTWVWSFQAENSSTRVSTEVEYELIESVWQKIINKTIVDKLNQRSAEQMLENLRIILES